MAIDPPTQEALKPVILRPGQTGDWRMSATEVNSKDRLDDEPLKDPGYMVPDEIMYWKDIERGTGGHQQSAAASVLQLIEEINKELCRGHDYSTGFDLFDGISGYLFNLWQLGEQIYPVDRLCHLLNTIANQIIRLVEDGTGHLRVWFDEYTMVEKHLTWGIAMCGKMNEMCEKLTVETWPQFDPGWRPYTLGKYIPPRSKAYWIRLTKVYEARSLHRQMLNILTLQGCPDLAERICFRYLKDVQCMSSSSDNDEFKIAYVRFERSLIPAEAKIANKLRPKLGNEMTSFQLLGEYRRYEALIRRPKILRDLRSNREHFLVIIRKTIENYQESVANREFGAFEDEIAHSKTAKAVLCLRHVLNKVRDSQSIGAVIFHDLSDYPPLAEKMTNLQNVATEMAAEYHDQWMRTIQRSYSLSDGTTVIQFNDETQLLQVNYNPQLRFLTEDANKLAVHGYRLPAEQTDTVDRAGLFLKLARELDQIACFHNTIGDRMVPCLRPMMLDSAMALSHHVSSQEKLTWTEPIQIGEYIEAFHNLVHNLSRENSYLSDKHYEIEHIVDPLLDMDLLSEYELWKNALKEVRVIFKTVEAKGMRNLLSWKLHWDRQIYKYLEVAYIRGLEDINTRLPAIAIQIVYREQALQFKPSIEEFKLRYYIQLSKYVNLPKHFEGVNDESTEPIFEAMIYMNSRRFQEIYERGERLIRKVLRNKDKFDEWVALGSVEIDSICEKFLKTADDWDRNFKICKAKSQELKRLPFTEQIIGPFRLNFGLLQMEIELLHKKYTDVLTTLLQNSIMGEMACMQTYLGKSIKKMNEKPTTLPEITSSMVLRSVLSSSQTQIQSSVTMLENKNRILGVWSKDRVSLSRIHTLMENFDTMLDDRENVVGRQVEAVKSTLSMQIVKLNSEITDFKLRWDVVRPEVIDLEDNSIHEFILLFREREDQWRDMMKRRNEIIDACSQLAIEDSDSITVTEVNNDFQMLDVLLTRLDTFLKELGEFREQDWIIFRTRTHVFQEFLLQWAESFQTEHNREYLTHIIHQIEELQGFIPTIKYIRGDIFSERHWYELFQILGMQIIQLADLKAKHFLDVRKEIVSNYREVKELNGRATGETAVRQALSELDAWEVEAAFTLSEKMDSKVRPVVIIEDFKSVLDKVGDNQSLLQSMKSSPYYSAFGDRISQWEIKLTDVESYLQSLSQIQRRWIYLEPIFSHGVLDTEQARFTRIDLDFRKIMSTVHGQNRVCVLTRINNLRRMLSNMLEQLAQCQSSLNEFLEIKRSGFPRFYFLGDDDLLEILGQSTNANIIQAHLKKLFAGIYSVNFDPEGCRIVAMKSLEGEVVPLKSHVKISINVEEWLSELANEMKYTLKSYSLECVSGSKNEQKDPDKYPAQILSLCNSIVFTDRCEEGIRSGKLERLLSSLRDELDSYTTMEISPRHTNPEVLELKLKELILDLIHQIDILGQLISAKVRNVTDWVWQKQLRFYIRDDDGVVCARMADAEFTYSYEYQGNAPKYMGKSVELMIERRLIELLNYYLGFLHQGMRMGLGGNPFGPAGTGKTESVKALGGLLGRQVLVFNCDEGIDVKAMGRIFTGLVKCGAWGCFDEFNRLEGATLSAVSMQIQPIQKALKDGSPTVRVLDETVALDQNAGIFVTLNPAGKGYGGRNELPDNLKQLFRPVIMSSPNNDLIAEVILYTEGFKHAKRIGFKLVEVFTLSFKLLTPQKHYDWGLRALKTVLKGCGSSLRAFKKAGVVVTEKDESDIVVAALRLNTLPKLTHADAFRFDKLIKDMFAGVTFKELGDSALANCIREVIDELNLEPMDNQIRKCLELHEQLQQRMGVVIVGPSCCGKSTICRILKHTLIKMGQVVSTHTINPKAMTRPELLGHINADTRLWTDGVLTLKALQVYNQPQDVTSWIICDGDIDPEWIESLNSVLDDNRLLTLPSGWRIKFGLNVNFIFETHDLIHASPATISRMGMILMSELDISENGIIKAWLKAQPEETAAVTTQLFDDYFYRGLRKIIEYHNPLELTLVSIVQNALSQMHRVTQVRELAAAMIRGFTGHLSSENRIDFGKHVITLTDLTIPSEDIPSLVYHRKKDQLEVFTDEVLNKPPEGLNISQPPLVKTANTKQVLLHIRPWLKNAESFLLTGPAGCGKTLILENAFNELKDVEVAKIYCSSLSSPQQVLQKLSQVCITSSSSAGRVYKAKTGGRLILYFKDLNLVKPDKWGTCALVEFLQQIIKYKGFYDKNLEWVNLADVQIVASISDGLSRSRHKLSSRFTCIVRICSVLEPNSEQLGVIYQSYMTLALTTFHPESPIGAQESRISELSHAMVKLYDSVAKAFESTTRTHYHFTPRDVTNWVFGMMKYDLSTDSSTAFKQFREIWVYEAARLFRDKLVSAEHKNKFDQLLQHVWAQTWKIEDWQGLQKGIYYVSASVRSVPSSSVDIVRSSRLLTAGSSLGKVPTEFLKAVVEKGLAQVAREFRDLKIVTFTEVLDNVAYFDRVLSSTSSSMVLAGRAGIGRRTALNVVATLHGATIFTLRLRQDYGVKHFKLDLKSAIQLSAVEGNQVYFIIEDFQLIDPIFLDMLNGVISCGDVPGLYTPEELETTMNPLRDVAAAEGYTSSLFSFFSSRIMDLLHVVLIMDYTNPNFKVNCDSNPAIYKQCSMIWLEPWSMESLLVIPRLILEKSYRVGNENPIPTLQGMTGPTGEQAFLNCFRQIYSSLSAHLTSPRRFTAFIHTYAMIFNKRKTSIQFQIGQLKAGVHKLDEARTVVEELRADAGSQEVTLAEKQQEAQLALDQITITMGSANVQRDEMEALRQKTLKENDLLLIKKASIDEELKTIGPMLAEAQSAVGSIKSEALTEIRSLRAPPEAIRDILEAVLRLMGNPDASWQSMKGFVSQRGVKEKIQQFDATQIVLDNRLAVEALLVRKADSFIPVNAKRASTAAAPLAAWVVANVKYSKVLEKIEPLSLEQARLEQNLKMAEQKIEVLSNDLSTVDQKVEYLKKKMQKSTKEAAEIEFHLNNAKTTLAAAEGLVGKLSHEFSRWHEQLTDLASQLELLPIQTVLAAAFITYLSDANEETRESYVEKWLTIFEINRFDFCEFMSTEQELLSFQAMGLPPDRLAQENALIILQTALRPFLIDPSSRATIWLKKFLEKDRKVVIVSLRDPKFSHELELAIRFGKTLIISEAEDLEPLLIPILRGDLVSQGSRDVVNIGEKSVDYNPEFRLYMSTRNPNPILQPDCAAVVTIVNFSTTRAGLTTQLLTTTLGFEKPDLEKQKTQLLEKTETLKLQLTDLGELLLKKLASAEGNILENKDLLKSLQQTKEKSIDITRVLGETAEIETVLNTEINVYRPLAEFGSRVFYAILDIQKLNKLYTFSLACFVHLFSNVIAIKNESASTGERIHFLQQHLENNVYEYVCSSLFKVDRLTFAMHIAHAIHPEAFGDQEWGVFTGELLLNQSTIDANPGLSFPRWVPEDRALPLALLAIIHPNFFAKLQVTDTNLWAEFARSTECEQHVPAKVSDVLTPFQVVLLIQALRPDRLVTAMTIFARKILGRKSLFPPPVNFQKMLLGTRAKEPVLILIGSGADPSQELRELADTTVGIKKYYEISMGQDDSESVLKLIHEAAKDGKWICLKNLHLVTHWLDSLEKEIQTLSPSKDFRLWLISEPHEHFPQILAESCLKVAFEAPQGIKKNLQRTYSTWTPHYVTMDGNVLRTQTLFALAFFHAIVQERRTYIPQGWSKFYEFNESDLRAGADVLDRVFKASRGKPIQWDYIHGLYENAIYGGRVDNTYDSKVLAIYLQEFFNQYVLSGTTGRAKKMLYTGIELPTTSNYQAYLEIFENLPDYDNPKMFGLPTNIERSWQKIVGTQVINQLQTCQRKILEDSGYIDAWINDMRPYLNLWKKVNQESSVEMVPRNKSERRKSVCQEFKYENPIEGFIRLEVQNMKQFIQDIHSRLSKLSRGARGADPETVLAYTSLSQRETPEEWRKVWEGPEDPYQFIPAIADKNAKLDRWIKLVEQGTLLGLPLNLSDLLNPAAFLNAFKQHCARAQTLSMDEVKFVCTWKSSSDFDAKISCRLTGLYLEGCGFNGVTLQESKPESPTITKVPDCTIAFVPIADVGKYMSSDTVSVPLYHNSSRLKLIGNLEFPSTEDESENSKWIKAGVGLFLTSY